MSQSTQYYSKNLKDKYAYKKNNTSKTYTSALNTEIKHRIKDTFRNWIKKNHMPREVCITIQNEDLSIMMSRSSPTTRKMLDCMKNNNFKGIIKHMSTLDQTNYLAIVDFCKCLETAVNIMRLIADNAMRKMTLEDYQQGLFDIMQAAGALADNPKSASKRRDLENEFNAFLRRLESHATLTEMLEEYGETEEKLDKRMSESLLKF